jgi:hypothetical protein
MTNEYCIQKCLAWSPHFTHAGVEAGDECWCDSMESNDGIVGTNQCVAHCGNYCKDGCKGDPTKQSCGGFWAANVFAIRPESFAESAAAASFLLPGLLLLAACTYIGAGVGYGARKAGAERLRLELHPHHGQWAELRALCVDGLQFTRSGGKPGGPWHGPNAPLRGGHGGRRSGMSGSSFGGEAPGTLAPATVRKTPSWPRSWANFSLL